MAEQDSQANTGEKNWKETREKLEFLEGKVAAYEEKERVQIFKDAGLDTSKGVGKAVDKLFEGEVTVENIQQYATEEFGVEFGQQDGIQQDVPVTQAIDESQSKLDNIQKNSVVDVFGDDIVSHIREVESKGTTKQSIAAKLFAIEEAKKNDK